MSIYVWQDYSAMQWPAPSWFHVPSKDDFDWLASIMSSLWLWSKDSWVQNLHIPLMWELSYNWGTALQRWTHWYYWLCSTNNSYVRDFMMAWNDVWGASNNSTYWCPIRPFKNLFEVPTSWWTIITWTLGWAGIFWDTTNWLISITWDWTTWYTIADKNLWATTVYNNGDTLSANNCWWYFQWWNNYMFPFSWTLTTSSTQVNAQNYWPWNYYSNSIFITTSSIRWDSSNNDNLRWWVTWVKPWEVKNIYIGEVYSWPLRFKAEEANSTISLNKTGSPTSVTLETSTDWTTWSTYTFWTTITLSNIGDKVYMRNTSTSTTWFSTSSSNYYQFSMTWSISCSWSVNYLLNKTGEASLSTWCYVYLFKGCSSLVSAPELPSETLANNCYVHMFNSCTSLITPPKLPATTAKDWCYNCMFEWCTSLTTAPSLPATTLGEVCYSSMFEWCSNLETLPALPATTLTIMCYTSMFSWCSKIKLSETQTWDYQTPYRIPTTWTGTTASNAILYMFLNTWWSWSWNPSINTTYYTSNTVV